jgi:trimeric autotransporter adhesin
MTYSVGGLIEATDYNGFVNTGANNINKVWSTGTGDSGWGQTAISTVSAGGTVTATQWATLVANLATAGSQTGSTLTSRTQPVAGNIISILANVATDINTITNDRGNAAASGTEYGVFSGTTSKTSATGSGQSAWTITFTHTVTFASADALRYFFNAGGIVRLKYGKSSTGTDNDPDWNTLAGWCGSINLTGRVNGAAQTIAATSYTGTTRIGGSGGTQTTLATTTGWYNLTGSPTTIFQLNNSTAPYSGEFIRTTATATSSTVLTLVTTWVSDGSSGAGTSADISGGSATNSPSTTITGTAPTTLVTYIPPSTSFLSNTWGTPTIAASVS